KVGEFLIKAKIREGQVVLIGGVTQNRHLIGFLREAWPKVEFVTPLEACWFEAYGAAIAARERGRALPAADLLRPRAQSEHGLYRPLATARDQVTYHQAHRGSVKPGHEYILGIDGGSTTTKAALIDRETLELTAAHYGRTHGDPVGALKECLRRIREQCGGVRPSITLAATTGSSRELLGVFVGTDGVYNEIIAHATGTAHFAAEVDTLFEIGGQDAKYVLLNNGVPIDYAMNEACSAGTGSFLEESAAGDLDIGRAEDIGPIALEARAPLKFGEHCSAFINSDIRKAIQEGSERADIVAGLVFSIVSNYLNRVVGNRTIGDRIALQGGVAKNPAVPLAFAQLLGKHITVPPDPELMGSFGVARLARRKNEDGLLPEGTFDLDTLIEKDIVNHGEFVCRACDNYCTIRNLEAGGKRYPFGGRCSKYTGARRRTSFDESSIADHVAWRTEQHFSTQVPDPASLTRRSPAVVGVPVAFSVHSLWPFYAQFFHELGVRTVLSEKVLPEGVYRQESNYCFPAEIAHGAIQDLIDRGADHLFLPHFRDMPTMEEKTAQSCVCPLTQGLPYYAKQAFGLDDAKILRPVVSFKEGWDACRPEFEDVAEKLGLPRSVGRNAFDTAIAHYRDFMAAYKKRGRELVEEMRANPDRLYVALLGRPYNAFTRDANMGI
ncbi:MAG TPA: acyl-CoA dehydratase activase, partial [bacterium]|nr:acyl-CoA dehydratase activase [bacterium]